MASQMTLAIDTEITTDHFAITTDAIKSTVAEHAGLTGLVIKDQPDVDQIRKARIELKNVRVAIEKRRKELKADSLEFGRNVDKVAKFLTAMVAPTEKALQDKEDAWKDAREQKRKEKLQKRLDALATVGASAPVIVVERLDDDAFANLLAKETEAFHAEQERIKKEAEEEARLKAEELARLAEEQRLAEEKRQAEEARLAEERRQLEEERARLKAEADERQRQENERLRVERERLEAQRKEQEERDRIQREEQERIAAENRKLEEARLLREQEERDRIELERRKLEEDRLRLEREEQERIDAKKRAEAEEQERKRLEAIRPDREKLLSVAAALRELSESMPTVETQEAYIVRDNISGWVWRLAGDVDKLVNEKLPSSEEE